MAVRCLTNNPLLVEQGILRLEYHDTDILSLFSLVEREIRNGYSLLSHPLSGSIRPDMTPYKTVFLSGEQKRPADPFSLHLIKEAIRYTATLYLLRDKPLYLCWGEEAKKDFQLIDCSIAKRALETMEK